MKKIFLAAVGMMFMLAAYNANAQDRDFEENYIQVSTKAEREVTPDEIFLAIQIKEEGGKGKQSLKEIETEMIKALAKIKIDVEKNLTVNDLDSDLHKYFLKKDGILESKNYLLKVSTAAQAAQAMQVLNEIRIHDISLSSMRVSKELQERVVKELIKEAGNKAKEQAQLLAESVGSKAGRCIYINYYEPSARATYGGQRIMMAKNMNIEEASCDSVIELEASKTTLFVNITCKFAIN